jgi:hypothetical protein
MIRSTILVLAALVGWSLLSDDADARHGLFRGRFGCAGRAASCAGESYGCQGQAATSCAGEHSIIVRHRAPVRRTLRAAAAVPVLAVRGAAAVVTAPVRRLRVAPSRAYGGCANGTCRR